MSQTRAGEPVSEPEPLKEKKPGAGAVLKKKSGAGAAKKLADSSALLEDTLL